MYVYKVTIHADGNPYHWFMVYPTKKQAMIEAREQAKDHPKKDVKYFKENDLGAVNASYAGHVVVEQCTMVYHGA